MRQHYGVACFADDTGLEVNALDGAPGVYSARYAGPQRQANDNVAKLLHELHGPPTARRASARWWRWPGPMAPFARLMAR